MSEITVTVWEVDPAFSLIGENGLAHPPGWGSAPAPGASPYGTDATRHGGDPVDISGYVREVRLVDRDEDGFIGGNYADSFWIGEDEFVVSMIYRGDVMTVDAQSYQTITLYGYTAGDAKATAITLPVDSAGNIVSAYPGLLRETLWSLDSEPYPIPIKELPCFLAGSLIATPSGPVPVEYLGPGDLVLTADHGPQPVVWAVRSRPQGTGGAVPPRLRPICVPQASFGATRDLWLSPLHRILCTDLAEKEVLVPLRHLRGTAGIGAQAYPDGAPVCYVHLALARHSVIFADGVACESFYAGPRALAMLAPEDRARLFAVLPELRAGERPKAARPLLDRLAMVRRRLQGAVEAPAVPLWGPAIAPEGDLSGGLRPDRGAARRTAGIGGALDGCATVTTGGEAGPAGRNPVGVHLLTGPALAEKGRPRHPS